MNKFGPPIKVLIVCSGNAGDAASFVKEQVRFLRKLGVVVDYFLIEGKGWLGYLTNYPALRRKIKSFQPSIVHAHYGMSGMLAVLQRKVPVIVTFHGSEINDGGFVKAVSMVAIRLSKYSIFVSKELAQKAKANKNSSVVSCGIDMESSVMMDKMECRNKLGFKLNEKYILFSSSFDIPIKNYKLAQKAIAHLGNVKLIELKGYTREDVNLLMNACDLLLVTSINEGGPLVVKEAIACGCPVVSTDVGDVKEVLGDIDGCYITDFSAIEISKKIQLILDSGQRIESRNRIYKLELDAETVAKKIFSIYSKILTDS